VNIGVEINQIRGQIEEIKSLLVNWGLKYTNSKPITKMKITVNFGADNWVWQGWNYMKLKVQRQLGV
jgi:hypothetical protein